MSPDLNGIFFIGCKAGDTIQQSQPFEGTSTGLKTCIDKSFSKHLVTTANTDNGYALLPG